MSNSPDTDPILRLERQRHAAHARQDRARTEDQTRAEAIRAEAFDRITTLSRSAAAVALRSGVKFDGNKVVVDRKDVRQTGQFRGKVDRYETHKVEVWELSPASKIAVDRNGDLYNCDKDGIARPITEPTDIGDLQHSTRGPDQHPGRPYHVSETDYTRDIATQTIGYYEQQLLGLIARRNT